MLKKDKKIADYWTENKEDKTITCHLSPRNCTLKDGQTGFCGVRGNVDNKLYTFNFGKSVEATIEHIETEAVYHHSPGARILSLGNVGCMMACSFCQNWSTSQVKHLNISNVKYYTPFDVIEMALKNNINIISWTYNDPVVWQEFVVRTSKLAHENGIKTLYKSALYIEPEPLAELIEVIDIFSISLKSMSEELYRKVTKGRLQPVLDGINQIARSGKHLEISQLIVTGLNDNDEDARKTSKWIVDNLGMDIPLHFVGYHPAYRYDKPRTSLEKLLRARDIAVEEGIKHCYLGNMYQDDVSNTRCSFCDHLLIQRYGMTVYNRGLDNKNCCLSCGKKSQISGEVLKSDKVIKIESKASYSYDWKGSINSIHLLQSYKKNDVRMNIFRVPSEEMEYMEMNAGIERLIISKASEGEQGIRIEVDCSEELFLLPVLDRAHFPVLNDSQDQEKFIN